MKFSFFRKRDVSLLNELQEAKIQGAALEEKMSELENQLQKSTRLQYKTGKVLEEKLDKLPSVIGEELGSNHFSESERDSVISKIIKQIDDMDLVISHLHGQNQWEELIQKWTESSLSILNEMGVHEAIYLGDIFDPTLAEAIESIPFTEPHRPLEIVKIYKRSFTNKKGTLIRKGQVVTMKEE